MSEEESAKLEGEIHADFIQWLNAHDYGYTHSRMDKRTTNKRGEPDFVIYRDGQCLFIEIKRPGKKLSATQVKRKSEIEASGNVVKLAYSLQECIHAVLTHFTAQNPVAGHCRLGARYPSLDCEGVSGDGKGKLRLMTWKGTRYVVEPSVLSATGVICRGIDTGRWKIVRRAEAAPDLALPNL